jgi:hypothetical protein
MVLASNIMNETHISVIATTPNVVEGASSAPPTVTLPNVDEDNKGITPHPSTDKRKIALIA